MKFLNSRCSPGYFAFPRACPSIARPRLNQRRTEGRIQRTFLIGTAVNRGMVTAARMFRERGAEREGLALVKEQFNQITAENDMKWQLIHPRKGERLRVRPLSLRELRPEQPVHVVGHTLVWHSQTPNWVFAGTNPPPSNATTSVAANTNTNTNTPATNQFGRGRFGGFGGGFGRYNGPRASRADCFSE
jgi:hypothetical protein